MVLYSFAWRGTLLAPTGSGMEEAVSTVRFQTLVITAVNLLLLTVVVGQSVALLRRYHECDMVMAVYIESLACCWHQCKMAFCGCTTLLMLLVPVLLPDFTSYWLMSVA